MNFILYMTVVTSFLSNDSVLESFKSNLKYVIEQNKNIISLIKDESDKEGSSAGGIINELENFCGISTQKGENIGACEEELQDNNQVEDMSVVNSESQSNKIDAMKEQIEILITYCIYKFPKNSEVIKFLENLSQVSLATSTSFSYGRIT